MVFMGLLLMITWKLQMIHNAVGADSYGRTSICPCNISILQTVLVNSELPGTVQTMASLPQSPSSCTVGLLAELSTSSYFCPILSE